MVEPSGQLVEVRGPLVYRNGRVADAWQRQALPIPRSGSRLNRKEGNPVRRHYMLPTLVFLSLCAAGAAPAAADSTVLVGNASVASVADGNASGRAHAFKYTAVASGNAASITVYVDNGTTATGLTAAIYSNKAGHPGSLSASGSSSTLTGGQWNQVKLNSTASLSSGKTYWIAILGTGGTLAFRDQTPSTGSCSQTSYQSNLTSLPSNWTSGKTYSSCALSAYASTAYSTSAAPLNTAPPAVSGQAVQGSMLSTTTGTWANGPSSYGYQWMDCGQLGCTAIAGATSTTYTLQAADVGYTIEATVIAFNSSGSASATSAATGVVTTRRYVFGTLNTSSTNGPQEAAAGLNTAEVDVGWDLYEPQDGVFNSNYAASVAQTVRALHAAGDDVVLGLALHYPPSWVFSYANARLVNQYGATADEPNLIFNEILRQKAAALISRINQDVGLNSFYAIRITSGGDAEAMYPSEDADGIHGNSYWAYGANAQTGADLPPTIPVNPFPGWKPGQTAYNGHTFSSSQVQQWYGWYLTALLDEVNWQIQTYKSLGYTGYLQVLTPGMGSRPDEYQAAISNYLNGTGDSNGTMGRGAAWDEWYAGLPDKTHVVAYVSSLADGSGSPANNLCQASDSTVTITAPQIDSWSAARWISYIAKRYNLPTNGENPGGGANYGLTMMQTAAKQMQACGMQGMYWAHDSNLYDGVSGVTLQDYANVIAQYG
jgi:hypothetical protein